MGVLQGFTEFLPVSSSGHLEIFSHILGVNSEENLSFSIVVHAGTVLSTIVVFWSEIMQLIRGFFRFKMNNEMKFVIKIFISAIPILVVGLTMKDYVESLFGGNLLIVGVMLLITAIALWGSSRSKYDGDKDLTYSKAFLIGLAQSCAVLPGLSRSGATISTGLMLGIGRQEVAKFSFLMVLIPIIGANLLEVLDGGFAATTLPPKILLIGFISSFISGTLACKLMISIIGRGKLGWFAFYCLIVGIATIFYSL